MTKKDLKELRVGDEVLVDTFDYREDRDAKLREVITEVEDDSICTLSYDGSINFYDDRTHDLKFILGKTGRHFPEMAEILRKLKEGEPNE